MYEIIKELCNMNNISIRSLEESLGFANGTVRKWNTCNPGVKQVIQVSNYFGVSVEVILGKEPISAIKQYPELDLAITQLNTEGIRLLTIMAKALVGQSDYKKSCIG